MAVAILSKFLILNNWKAAIIFSIAMMVFVYGDERNCPPRESHKNSGLYFIRQPAVDILTCEHSYVDMYCCVAGYKSMRWLKKDLLDGEWFDMEPYLGYGTSYKEGNQTLVNKEVIIDYDATQYRCEATDEKGNVVMNEVNLDISQCVSYNKPPHPMTQNGSYVNVYKGENTTVVCEGFYGPNYRNDPDPIIGIIKRFQSKVCEWYPQLGNSNEDSSDYCSSHKANYTQEEYSMKIVLPLYSVTDDDYGEYVCIFGNGQGSVRSTVIVQEPDNGDREGMTMMLVITCTLAVALVLAVIVTVLYHKLKLDIQMYIKDRWNRPINPDKVYDAFVVHNEDNAEDRKFIIANLLPMLEKKYNYKLCIAFRDFIVGDPQVNNYINFIDKSQCLVFILTPAFLANEWCEYTFQHAVARKYRDMVFIIYKKIPDNMWKPHMNPMRKEITWAKYKITWPAVQQSESQNSFRRRLYSRLLSIYKTKDEECSRSEESTSEDGVEQESSQKRVSNDIALQETSIDINTSPSQNNAKTEQNTDVSFAGGKTQNKHCKSTSKLENTNEQSSIKGKAVDKFYKLLRLALQPRLAGPKGKPNFVRADSSTSSKRGLLNT